MADLEEMYHWSRNDARSWRIGFGPSNFLVAEGSGFSLKAGEKLLELLKAEEADPDIKDWWKGDDA